MTNKKDQYLKQYEKINNDYFTNLVTLEIASQNEGINVRTYNRICKVLNKKSAAKIENYNFNNNIFSKPKENNYSSIGGSSKDPPKDNNNSSFGGSSITENNNFVLEKTAPVIVKSSKNDDAYKLNDLTHEDMKKFGDQTTNFPLKKNNNIKIQRLCFEDTPLNVNFIKPNNINVQGMPNQSDQQSKHIDLGDCFEQWIEKLKDCNVSGITV